MFLKDGIINILILIILLTYLAKCQCPSGHCGQNCTHKCEADNCESCDVSCKSCISCVNGYWNPDDGCIDRCPIHCGTPNCDQETGLCPGICASGYWSGDCSKKCHPGCSAECDKVTSTCSNCKPNHYDSNCTSICVENCPFDTCDYGAGTCDQNSGYCSTFNCNMYNNMTEYECLCKNNMTSNNLMDESQTKPHCNYLSCFWDKKNKLCLDIGELNKSSNCLSKIQLSDSTDNNNIQECNDDISNTLFKYIYIDDETNLNGIYDTHMCESLKHRSNGHDDVPVKDVIIGFLAFIILLCLCCFCFGMYLCYFGKQSSKHKYGYNNDEFTNIQKKQQEKDNISSQTYGSNQRSKYPSLLRVPYDNNASINSNEIYVHNNDPKLTLQSNNWSNKNSTATIDGDYTTFEAPNLNYGNISDPDILTNT